MKTWKLVLILTGISMGISLFITQQAKCGADIYDKMVEERLRERESVRQEMLEEERQAQAERKKFHESRFQQLYEELRERDIQRQLAEIGRREPNRGATTVKK